ncbi:MAG: trypsin-like peptidase domain-containing protein, partial [Candidatus Limnocylindria bacterium]
MRRLASLVLLLLTTPATCALVVDTDAGEANTRAPAPDPGWANLGRRGGYPAIYLGNGWVITAHHVGAGDVLFGAVTHHALPESTLRLGREGSPPDTDLVVFRIEPRPDLPTLPIRPTPPHVGDRALLIASGLDRGEPTTWNGRKGWTWGPQTALRWGTNRVAAVGVDVRAGGSVTPGFAMSFDARETRFEAQAAMGDSGGA